MNDITMQLELTIDLIELNLNSIEDKWDANCWRGHSKSSYEYEYSTPQKRQIQKNTFPCLFT
jgi:hypothetical protein